MTQRSVARLILLTVSILALAALSSGAALAGSSCVSADIDEPFRLPDGSLQPAGQLSLCLHSDLSPVASFHVTKVNGMPVGLHRSRRTATESDESIEPFIMFTRAPDGTLELLGYSHPIGGDTSVHAFARPVRTVPDSSMQADANAPVIYVAALLQR